jgi:hypothetical protein
VLGVFLQRIIEKLNQACGELGIDPCDVKIPDMAKMLDDLKQQNASSTHTPAPPAP